MTDSVAPDELIARYILASDWYRKKDGTVKPEAFIPPAGSLELSVTRHLTLSENEIWDIGRQIARNIPRTLHGRADVEVAHVIAQRLSVVPQIVPNNPNHANIVNWPLDKDAKMMLALEIISFAHFIATP